MSPKPTACPQSAPPPSSKHSQPFDQVPSRSTWVASQLATHWFEALQLEEEAFTGVGVQSLELQQVGSDEEMHFDPQTFWPEPH